MAAGPFASSTAAAGRVEDGRGCGLPRISGGSASAISLFEACSGLLRVTACRLARPAFPGLCHPAPAKPITWPRCSSASLLTELTDNYIRWAPSSHKVSAPKRRTEKGGLANGFQPVGDPAGQLIRRCNQVGDDGNRIGSRAQHLAGVRAADPADRHQGFRGERTKTC